MSRSDTRPGDPSGMVAAFRDLPAQLAASFADASLISWSVPDDLRSVTFCGMGGSAAAGDVVTAAFGEALGVPALTWRRHGVPRYVDPRSLVVCLSYSGGTEEALSAYDEARARGAAVLAVSSGGVLAERAKRDREPLVRVSGEAPMPRAGLGFLAGGLVGALASAGLLSDVEGEVAAATRDLQAAAAELAPDRDGGEAAEVARFVGGAPPVIWGAGAVGDVAAWRWKCAFNENAKVPAFASSMPELVHHEVVGWAAGTGARFRLVILRHPGEHVSIDGQLRATLEEVTASGLAAREVHARGENALAHLLSLIMIGDVASSFDALARGIDPAPIDAIGRVKARLEGTPTS